MITPRALGRQLRTPPLPRRPALPHRWRRLEPIHLVWLVVWAPWWVGNELAPPAPPRSRELEMTEQPEGTAGAWLLDTLDDLKLRFGLSWAAALLIRGAWLGGVAGIAWIIVAMLTGAPSPSLQQLGILVGIGAALGVVLRAFHRPRYLAIALLLERAFQLRSRLSTAVMALRFGGDAPGELHALQLADAANSLDRARRELRKIHWVPIREIFIAFIVALALLLLLVARRPEGEIPPAATAGFPGFVPVSERLAAQQQPPPAELPDAATLQEVEDLSRVSNQARQDLDAVRDALDDTAQTQPAADAIASENYTAANERLDESAGAVTQLPERERQALADRLDEAANRVSEDNADLADAAGRAADDVRAGEDSGAIDELGDQIEQTGEEVIPQESQGDELAASTGEAQEGAAGSSQGGAAEQPEPADGGSSSGEPGESGDPGAGMEASGGSGAPGESGQTASGEGSEGGASATDAGGSGDPSQQAGQDGGGGQSSGETGDDRAGQEGGEGDSPSGQQGDQEGASQGAGASGGNRETADSEEAGDGGGSSQAGEDEQAPESEEGQASDEPPTGGEGEDGEGDGTVSGGASISLPGTSGERVASGVDIGASSVGSGGGVGAASGDSTSGVSGSSGPDPNTVPAQWRDLVERYFREGGAP